MHLPTKHATREGREFLIRCPGVADAENLILYSKIMFASTDQTLTTPEAQRAWIADFEENPDGLLLIAEYEHEIVGFLFFAAQIKKKIAHAGEFGVSVHPSFRSSGIGRALIKGLLAWAGNNPAIGKIFLQVFATNTIAIKLYQDLGFVEEGRHIDAVRQKDGRYVDVIQMYVKI